MFPYLSVGEVTKVSKKSYVKEVVVPIIVILMLGVIVVLLALYWKKKLCFKSKLNLGSIKKNTGIFFLKFQPQKSLHLSVWLASHLRVKYQIVEKSYFMEKVRTGNARVMGVCVCVFVCMCVRVFKISQSSFSCVLGL